MRKTLKGLLTVLFAISMCLLGGLFLFAAEAPAKTINLPVREFQNVGDDEEEPDVTDRVARISFLRGESRIRRLGAEEWEKTTLNLPIVEGDEITTDGDGRIEIQFDKHQHLRLAENSYLKIINLKDEGIAVSLSLGTLSLRITAFDKDKSFFEIDAPKTTMAIQSAGAYRVDAGKAGKAGDSEVRVTTVEGGEARVYSDNAGFTVKNGRSTRIFIDGLTAGEWETTDASRFVDEFGTWSAERDLVIAKRLRGAHYDKFYDSDIYGADDLNGNGDWVDTINYGYVWRPNRTSISRYADWSPYRYGHWRWMPPYGWIWVNDEPWGWATYHHGRWFYDDGYWNWSPYGYDRHRRSWWSGALVVISVVSNNICWYPLPYHRRRYNYNARYTKQSLGPRIRGRETVGIVGTVKGPRTTPVEVTGKGTRKILPIDAVPPAGVVAIDSKDFGTRVRSIRTATPTVAKGLLSKSLDDGSDVTLPSYADKRRFLGAEIVANKPDVDLTAATTRVGAAPRKSAAPLDEELRTKRVFGGRSPQKTSDNAGPQIDGGPDVPRKTGAVERPLIVRQIRPETPRSIPKESPAFEQERNIERPKRIPVAPNETPRYDPPIEREKPRYTPPPFKEMPRIDAPREKQRDHTPLIKSEPKQESKPTPPPSRKEKPDSKDHP